MRQPLDSFFSPLCPAPKFHSLSAALHRVFVSRVTLHVSQAGIMCPGLVHHSCCHPWALATLCPRNRLSHCVLYWSAIERSAHLSCVLVSRVTLHATKSTVVCTGLVQHLSKCSQPFGKFCPRILLPHRPCTKVPFRSSVCASALDGDSLHGCCSSMGRTSRVNCARFPKGALFSQISRVSISSGSTGVAGTGGIVFSFTCGSDPVHES